MAVFPPQIRADRLLGGRLRLGVYGGERLDMIANTTPEYALVWVLRGSGTYVDDRGRSWPFTAGDVYQRFPGRVHSHRWRDPRRGLTCFAAVPAPLLAGLRAADPPGLRRAVFRIGDDSTLAQRWAALAGSVRRASERELPRQLAAVFALVAEVHARCADHQGDAWLDRAEALIEQHLADRLPMPAVLAPLDGSYAANRARFARLAGRSPGAHRLRRRMELAQDLLTRSDEPIARIGERLGFGEPANFSKHFRIHCGCSPSAYRSRPAG